MIVPHNIGLAYQMWLHQTDRRISGASSAVGLSAPVSPRRRPLKSFLCSQNYSWNNSHCWSLWHFAV